MTLAPLKVPSVNEPAKPNPAPSGVVLTDRLNFVVLPSFQMMVFPPPLMRSGAGEQPLAMVPLVPNTTPDFNLPYLPLGDRQLETSPMNDTSVLADLSGGVKLNCVEPTHVRSSVRACAAVTIGVASNPTEPLRSASTQAWRSFVDNMQPLPPHPVMPRRDKPSLHAGERESQAGQGCGREMSRTRVVPAITVYARRPSGCSLARIVAASASATRTDGDAQRNRRAGGHAVVVGAGIAGLLAARVLADAFDRVTVVDRDGLPDGLADHRRAVPQGRHAHGLQFGGQEALEALLPGFRAEALRCGAPLLRDAREMRLCLGGHQLPRVNVGFDSAVASRPLLEGLIRKRVRSLPNVALREHVSARELLCDGGRVTGVRTSDRDDRALKNVRADLVVAATGRGGRVPAWLASIGYERPHEDRVDVDLLYASRHLRLRPGAFGTDKLVVNASRVGRPRGMAMVVEEGDRWNLMLYGYGVAHHPPADVAGFSAFAASVADPDVFSAIDQAKPLDAIATYAFPANLRRRYERLRRFPEGLLVVGDAVCSFNPIYGQGMSVATLQARVLQRCLRGGHRRLARRFFRMSSKLVDDAWKLATAADLSLPEVDARASPAERIVNRYVARLLAVAEHDDAVAAAFVRVTGMLAPPTHLLRPGTASRVLAGSLRHRGP